MVNQCMNPTCHTEFRLLNSGDLYAVDRPDGDTEFFWICARCAKNLELHLDRFGDVILVRKGSPLALTAPRPRASLRLVAQKTRRLPWRYAIPATARCQTVQTGNWGSYSHVANL